MKNNMKKVLALALAAMMVLALCGVAFADTTPAYDTTVTVSGLAEGDVAKFYKIVEWVGEADGNVRGWKVVSPFSFDLNAVLVGTLDDSATTDVNEYVAPTGITAGIANSLAATSGKTQTGSDVTVGSDGTASLDVSTHGAGIYMVLITPTDRDVVYNPVFVSSDYAAGGSNTWAVTESATYSNNAASKKSTTTLNKTAATTETAPDDVNWITTAIGDTVNFTVTTMIPGFGPAFVDPFFKMTDNLTDLTLVQTSVSITSPSGLKAYTSDSESWDYKLTTSDTEYSIVLNPAYLATVSQPTGMTVTYNAIVNTDAPLNVNFERNEVWTEFSHDINNTSDHSFKKDDTIHYTFTIDANALANGSDSEGKKGSEIVKVGVDASGNPISSVTETSSITSTSTWQGPQAGAHFKLYRDANCTEEYIPKVKGTGAAGTALDIVTGTDGRMTIAGLDAGEYWLKEVSCPAGFVMDTHVAHIVISTVESDKNITEWTTNGTTWISQAQYDALTGDKSAYKSYTYSVRTLDSYKVTINDVEASSYTFVNNGVEPEIKWTETPPVELPHQFTNTQGLQLPSTGGIGTTIFYVTGLIMVLGASVILVSRRRADTK